MPPILPKYRHFAAKAEITTRTYRGPDRRDPTRQADDDAGVSRQVRFDDKGNPVLEVRTDVPRRREEDETIDLIKCLDADELKLVLDSDDDPDVKDD